MGPRVPSLRRTRLAVLGVVAMLAVLRARVPAATPPLAWVTTAAGCRLDRSTAGPTCPCDELPTRARRLLGLPLSLDRASVADLVELPGIGAVRARAIVRERERRGPYSDVEALERVPGIGPTLAARLAPWVYSGDHDPACD